MKEYSQLIAIVTEETNSTGKIAQIASGYKDLLLNIKHKGALSSVYETFLKFLKKMTKNQDLCKIPSDWLLDISDSLDTVSPVLSFTRRSGGLPLLFLALVICESENMQNREVVSKVVSKLTDAIAQDKLESKIHAINILRTLFKDSSVGADLLNFAESVFCSCINGFAAQDWSVRNGCLMLFSSLVLRIFGCNREASNQTIIQISFDDFHRRFNCKLVPLMVEELTVCTKTIHQDTNLHPSLFPILSIMARLAVSDPVNVCSIRQQFVNNVMKCFSSPVLKIREIASTCLIRLIPTNSSYLNNFITVLFSQKLYSNNWIHSCLFVFD